MSQLLARVRTLIARAYEKLTRGVGSRGNGAALFELSSHPNGFLREKAVRRLRLVSNGSELPYLLLRLNDWVPEVREAARAAVLERVKADYFNHFVRNLALVVRLRQARRADHHDVLERISQLLSSPAARVAMLAEMNGGSREVRRESFRILVAGKVAELPQILLATLEVEDPVIRLWSARAMATALSREQLVTVLPKLSADPSAPVRREALQIWVTSFPEQAGGKLTAALLDHNPSVRSLARFHLRKQEDLDIVRFYRDALETPRTDLLVASIRGLAETGARADAESLLPYLSHPIAKVRKIAIKCLIMLGNAQYLDSLLDRVLDTSPGVSTQARQVAQPYAAILGAPRLWDLFKGTTSAHARKNLLHLLTALPKWDSVVYLLRAVSEGDEVTAEQARDHLLRWVSLYNRNQTAPSKMQLEQLKTALSEAQDGLDVPAAKSIRFTIQFALHFFTGS